MSKAKATTMSPAPKRPAKVPAVSYAYALEQLYAAQDHDWVVDTIAPVLAWVPGTSKASATQPFSFLVEHTAAGKPARGTQAAKTGKAPALLARTDLAEVHLSLWSAKPRAAILEQVKP
jgi:hypothetical protein